MKIKWRNLFKYEINFNLFRDPLIGCELYKEKGCSHVDGFLCDYPNCCMLDDYRLKRNKTIVRRKKLNKLIKKIKQIITNKMNKNREIWNKYLTPKLSIFDVMQRALDWWHKLPIQDIEECRFGWANLCMKYYPTKTDCYHFTGEEVQYMWEQEHRLIVRFIKIRQIQRNK